MAVAQVGAQRRATSAWAEAGTATSTRRAQTRALARSQVATSTGAKDDPTPGRPRRTPPIAPTGATGSGERFHSATWWPCRAR